MYGDDSSLHWYGPLNLKYFMGTPYNG
jgi:hypothetical protein